MYLDYFQLERHPFRITPDTSLFYSGGNRGRGVVLDAMLYAIETGEGILKVVGEVGSGKTMLCRMLEEKLPETTEVVYLANPNLSAEEILYAIAFELKLPIRPDTSKLLVMQQLQNFLLKQHAANRKVLVIIEEAQGMPIDTLEEIRLFSNLETHRDKLLQIILFGQPELDRNLSGRDIRQLRERITHSFYLPPLTADEAGEYIRFRLGAAGCPSPQLFTRGAERLIARASGGLTRRINILADKALLAAFADNVLASPENLSANVPPVVTWRHALAAIRDSDYGFFPLKLLAYPVRTITAAALAALVVAGVMYSPFLKDQVKQLVSAPMVDSAVPLPMERGDSTSSSAPMGALDDAVTGDNTDRTAPLNLLDAVAAGDSTNKTAPMSTSDAVVVGDDDVAIAVPAEPQNHQDVLVEMPVDANEVEIAVEHTRVSGRLEIAADEMAEGVVQSAMAETVESANATQPTLTPVRKLEDDLVSEVAAAENPAPERVDPAPASAFFAEGEGPSLNFVKRPVETSWTLIAAETDVTQPSQVLPELDSDAAPINEIEDKPQSQAGSLTLSNSKHIRNRVIASIDWLEAADREGYTVQFLSGTTDNLEFAESFFARLDQVGLLDESYLCMSIIDGESYWTIKHGNFAGLSVGQRFINQLPGDLFDYKPFVQNMSSVECNTNHSLAALILE